MSEASVHFTDPDLSGMLSGFLRQRTTCAKDLARRIDVDPRAAEGYRAGRHLPPLPVFLRIVRALGDDIAEALIAPNAAADRLEQEVLELEAIIASKRATAKSLQDRRHG